MIGSTCECFTLACGMSLKEKISIKEKNHKRNRMIQEPLKDIMFIYKGLQLYRGTKKRPLPEVKGPQVVCTAGGRENPAVRPPGLGKTRSRTTDL